VPDEQIGRTVDLHSEGCRDAVGYRDVPDEPARPAAGQCGSSPIEDPDIIEKIITHLDAKAAAPEATRRRPPCRAPPQQGLFDETG